MMATSNYQQLVDKHGTYDKFVEACWRTLGECSVAEINEACRKYRVDLYAAEKADERINTSSKDAKRADSPTQPG